MTRPLTGCRVLVTRARPGDLAAKLVERGATVIHVPLISVVEPADGGRALRDVLTGLADFDWLVVTSPEGSERVGAAARRTPGVQLAAIGTATARVLERESGRAVDLVPAIQRADGLVSAFSETVTSPQRVLLAQADRAPSTLTDALRRAGHEVHAVTAYRTVTVEPERSVVDEADAVLFASGSAVESWCDAFGTDAPPLVVAIGPTTAAAADRFGLKVSAVAADHSLDGLVTELEQLYVEGGSPGTQRSLSALNVDLQQ